MTSYEQIYVLSIVHEVCVSTRDLLLPCCDDHWLDDCLFGLICEKSPIKVDVLGAIGMLVSWNF